MGWRNFSEDAQHWAFWGGIVVAALIAIWAGNYWNWWSYAWRVPPPIRALIVLAAVVLVFVLGLLILWIAHRYFHWGLSPFRRVTKPKADGGASAADLAEEDKQRARRVQARRHVHEIVEKRFLPSQSALDEAFRKCSINCVPDLAALEVLVRTLDVILSDAQSRAGEINVAANRSLQEAPESDKITPERLIDMLVSTLNNHFRLCRLFDHFRRLPAVMLARRPEIDTWKDSVERLMAQLDESQHFTGFHRLRSIDRRLPSSPIPKTAPRIVPARFGHETLKPSKSLNEGLFIENLGGPARDVVVHPFTLGRRVVRFTGPELPQLKTTDGERLRVIEVETEPHTFDLSLFGPFREWQQERGDLTLETVGRITYRDFDGNSYETFYRVGVDVLNEDTGIVVEFLDQRWV